MADQSAAPTHVTPSQQSALAALANDVDEGQIPIKNGTGGYDGDTPATLTEKGETFVGLGDGKGIGKMGAPATGTYRRGNTATTTGVEDVVPTGTGAPVQALGATLAPASLGIPTIAAPVLATQLATNAGPYATATDGGRFAAVLCNTAATMQVIDCLLPASPSIVATVSTTGGGRCIAWVGDVIWVLCADGKLQLWNAKTPTAPAAFSGGNGGILQVSSNPRGFTVFGEYAIVTDVTDANNFIIVDASNKSTPVIKSTLALGAYQPWATCVSGKHAYVALPALTVAGQSAAGAVQIIDISDLAAPAVIVGGANGIVAIPQAPHNLAVDNGLLFVSGYAGGAGTCRFYVVDVKNPETPVVRGSVVVHDAPANILPISNACLVVCYTGNVIDAISVATPSAPTLIVPGGVATQSRPVDVSMGNGYLICPCYSSNTVNIFTPPNMLTADVVKAGDVSAQKLTLTGDARIRGNVAVRGMISANGLRLENPPVVATDATVVTLISALTTAGLIKNA